MIELEIVDTRFRTLELSSKGTKMYQLVIEYRKRGFTATKKVVCNAYNWNDAPTHIQVDLILDGRDNEELISLLRGSLGWSIWLGHNNTAIASSESDWIYIEYEETKEDRIREMLNNLAERYLDYIREGKINWFSHRRTKK